MMVHRVIIHMVANSGTQVNEIIIDMLSSSSIEFPFGCA